MYAVMNGLVVSKPLLIDQCGICACVIDSDMVEFVGLLNQEERKIVSEKSYYKQFLPRGVSRSVVSHYSVHHCIYCTSYCYDSIVHITLDMHKTVASIAIYMYSSSKYIDVMIALYFNHSRLAVT